MTILSGQPIQYNPETKTAFTVINEPFYSAGKKLGWKNPDPGIGLNQSIIDFILKRKCHLVVKVDISGHCYWIYHDRLKQFMDQNNCDYTINGIRLKIISWKIFTRLNEF